ncbi:MAG: cytochrome c [Acidiferrobacterales bacterium]
MIKLTTAKIVLFTALISMVNAPSYAVTGEKPDARAVKRGAVLFQKNCAKCHGARGTGGIEIPPLIRGPGYLRPPALNDKEHAWHHTDEAILKTILEGSPRTTQMPAWKNIIKKSEALDIVAYIKSLWGSRELECQGPKHRTCKR